MRQQQNPGYAVYKYECTHHTGVLIVFYNLRLHFWAIVMKNIWLGPLHI